MCGQSWGDLFSDAHDYEIELHAKFDRVRQATCELE